MKWSGEEQEEVGEVEEGDVVSSEVSAGHGTGSELGGGGALMAVGASSIRTTTRQIAEEVRR